MPVTTTILYDTPANFTYDPAKIEIVGGVARLVNVPPFDTGNPTIVPAPGTAGEFEADGLISLSANIVATPPDAIQGTIEVDGVQMWWDGGAWAASAGTYAESNTIATLNANLSSLDISTGATIRLFLYLHSDAGTSTPTVSSVTWTYDFFVTEPAGPPECIVYGWVHNARGEPMNGVVVGWNHQGFEHGEHHVLPLEMLAITNPSGYWEIPVTETESLGTAPYDVRFTFKDRTLLFQGIQVPNESFLDFGTVTPVTPETPPTFTLPGEYNLSLRRDKYFKQEFIVRDPDTNVVVDLSNVTAARCQGRPDLVSAAEWSISLGSGITIDATAGKITIELTDVETAALVADNGVWALELDGWPNVGERNDLLDGTYTVVTSPVQ